MPLNVIKEQDRLKLLLIVVYYLITGILLSKWLKNMDLVKFKDYYSSMLMTFFQKIKDYKQQNSTERLIETQKQQNYSLKLQMT
jgi:hypothetical protein